MVVRVVVVGALWIQYGNGGRQHCIGHMMVADDEVDTQILGVSNFLNSLDATVQYDDEFHARFVGEVHTFLRNAISLFVAIGDIVVEIGIILKEEFINQRHGRTAINVIIAVDHDAFLASYSIVESANRPLHIVHQKRVVKIR